MYDVGGKLFTGIKSMYVRVKGGESECFRINSGERKGCILSPWLFNVFRRSDEGGENGDGEEGSEISGVGKS